MKKKESKEQSKNIYKWEKKKNTSKFKNRKGEQGKKGKTKKGKRIIKTNNPIDRTPDTRQPFVWRSKMLKVPELML